MIPIEQVRHDKKIMENEITESIRKFLHKHPGVILDIRRAEIINEFLAGGEMVTSARIEIEVKI